MCRKAEKNEYGQFMCFENMTFAPIDLDAVDISVMEDQIYGQLYQKETNQQKIITWFSLLAILISLVGVFGLIIFEAAHRRKEIGVRKVYGPPRDKFSGCLAAPTSRFPSSVHSWPALSPGMPYRNG